MNAVIVHFGKATFAEIEGKATLLGFVDGAVHRDDVNFYLRRYPKQELEAEYSPAELRALEVKLGTVPSSSFVVESRHGKDARYAFEVVAQLMTHFNPAVLDDDFGHLWSPEEIAEKRLASPGSDIFSFRKKDG